MPVNVIDTIEPKNGGSFPVVRDVDVAGGIQVQPNTNFMTVPADYIPTANQKVGMIVYVTSNSMYYQLTVVGAPGTWITANLGASTVTTLTGDVSGSSNSNTVSKIQGVSVSTNSVANDGYALVSTGGIYVPTGVLPTFNVKNFGAKGNGIANDTAAFTAAIAAKDAAGGGVIAIPLGTYILSSAIDLGSQPCVLRGSYWKCGNTSSFGDSSWNSLTSLSGTILHFTSTTNGITISTSLADGRLFNIEHLCLVGPGSGTTTGIDCSSDQVVTLNITDVCVANFSSGYFLGLSESGKSYNLFIFGCSVGLDGRTYLSSNYTNQHFYGINIQACSDAMILSGLQTVFYGGLVQNNTRGITIKAYSTGGTAEHFFNGIWFEDNGPPEGGPDVILDSSPGPIEDIGFEQCRLASDAVGFQWSGNQFSGTVNVQNGSPNITFTTAQSFTAGQYVIFGSQASTTYSILNATSNSTTAVLSANYTGTNNSATTCSPGNQGINFMTVKDCDTRGAAITLPAWLANGHFANNNNAGITDNSGGSIILNANTGTYGQIHGGYFEVESGASAGQVRLKADPTNGIKFASHRGSYDVSSVLVNNVDEVIIGDTSNGIVGLQVASGNYIYNQFGTRFDAACEDKLGTINTQQFIFIEKHVAATTTNATATNVSLTSPILGGAPASGHCWRMTVEWSCRDTTTGNSAAGTSKGIVSAANGIEGTPVYYDEGHNTALTGSNLVLSSGPVLSFTPPSGYSGTLDWTARVRFDGN
jgi:hypothetical protein